ncbi:hypothetical protein JTE90_001488 [Oedothorax gibbosus]|uniref:Uncharacterized protein n=1 Tax=Oedothorax gibbosus TaxID=931172 RepID=A0AAV6TNV2_9ARAC|nr:hypothetical protein JTE90_001488 [Oedothorax gibbosus]
MEEEFVCHRSSYRKVSCEDTNGKLSKNSSCEAHINVKVKLNTPYTRKNDKFIQKGLCGVINIAPDHKHRLNTAETLRFLPPSDCKEAFFEYFSDANNRMNPTSRAIRHWYEQWRLLHLGPRTGPDMISKLKEKIAIYEEASISVTFEENPFAVCIITPLMKRANESPSSANLVFVDSTSTCDGENHTITFF